MHGSGEIATYIHAGKIGVMVEVTCESDFIAQSEVFQALIHDLAMQVAANDPKFIRKANVPPEIVEHERESYRTQAAAGTCKPTSVIEKIVEGKVAKFYEETCLYEQPFIKDPSVSVSTLVMSRSRELGEKLAIRRFIRFKLGDSSYAAANDPGWPSDTGDEASVVSPKPVPPKSGSRSARAVPNLDDE
jgi:elongation factor Ts